MGENIFDLAGQTGFFIYLAILFAPLILGGGKFDDKKPTSNNTTDKDGWDPMMAFLLGWLLGGWGHHDRDDNY